MATTLMSTSTELRLLSPHHILTTGQPESRQLFVVTPGAASDANGAECPTAEDDRPRQLILRYLRDRTSKYIEA